MKKLLTFILALFATVSLVNISVNAEYYNFNIMEQEFRTHDGSVSVEKYGELDLNGVVSKQRINFVDFDLEDESMNLIALNAYQDFEWGMMTLEGMIRRFERENPNVEVLAGINGDFYDIRNTGRSSSVHVSDYEVVRGNSNGRFIFNIREDGTHDIKKSVAEGYEVLVKDEHGEIKFRQKLDHLNEAFTDDSKIGAFFTKYEGSIDSEINPVLIEASDIKYDGASLQFARGVSNSSASVDDVTREQFVLAGSSLTGVLSETDEVMIQVKLQDYEDVRGAVGGSNFKLVDNGAITGDSTTAKHPRTAIGIKEDGSVFFMVANGRDEEEDIKGITMGEMARVMKDHGAHNALNLDGGGSSTMMVKNLDGEFQVLNKLSDGRMRSISNGILLVRGDINARPVHIEGEDTRTPFNKPTNLYVDSDRVLKFDEIADATRYIVSVSGVEYETTKPAFDLSNLMPKDYNIKVRVKGNYVGSISEYSEEISYTINKMPVEEMIGWLRDFAKNNN